MTASGSACPSPIDEATLLDYWLGVLPFEAEDTVEEHLLACDACGNRLREAIALAEGLRALARSGSLRVVISEDLIDRAIEEGRRVREYAPQRGGAIQCTVSADDDLLVARLAADLRGAQRVDVSFCSAQGVEHHRLVDVPVREDAGAVVYQESIVFAKMGPSMTMITRLLGVDPDGTERLIGEYTFHHTRTIPGPPAFDPF